MLRNCKGFSLLEVMTGFAVLVMMIAVLSPLLEMLYKERQTVDQHYLALTILHNLLEDHLTKDVMIKEVQKIMMHHTKFYVTSSYEESTRINTYCVEWVGANEREYVKCGHAK